MQRQNHTAPPSPSRDPRSDGGRSRRSGRQRRADAPAADPSWAQLEASDAMDWYQAPEDDTSQQRPAHAAVRNDLERDLSKALAVAAALDGELRRLRAERDERDEALGRARSEQEALRGRLGDSESQLHARQRRIGELEGAVAGADERLERGQAEIQSLLRNVAAAEERVRERDREIEELRRRLAEQLGDAAELAESVRGLSQRLEAETGSVRRVLDREVAALRAHLRSAEERQRRAEAELSETGSSLAELAVWRDACDAAAAARAQAEAEEREAAAAQEAAAAEAAARAEAEAAAEAAAAEAATAEAEAAEAAAAEMAAEAAAAQAAEVTRTEPALPAEQATAFDGGLEAVSSAATGAQRQAAVSHPEPAPGVEPALETEPAPEAEEAQAAAPEPERDDAGLDPAFERLRDAVGDQQDTPTPGRRRGWFARKRERSQRVTPARAKATIAAGGAPAAIFHYWRDRQLRTKLAPLAVGGYDDFFAHFTARTCAELPDRTVEVLSLAGADPAFEARVAAHVLRRGAPNFRIHCLDRHAEGASRRVEAARARGLAGHVRVLAAEAVSDTAFDLGLADHSLAQFLVGEALEPEIDAALFPQATLVVGDRIGGHAGPSLDLSAAILDEVWRLLPTRLRERRPAGAAGVAADAAAALGSDLALRALLGLECEAMVAFGNLADAFVASDLGDGFDPESEADRHIVDGIAALDDAKIDAGILPPRHFVAASRRQPVERPLLYRGRTPGSCLPEDAQE